MIYLYMVYLYMVFCWITVLRLEYDADALPVVGCFRSRLLWSMIYSVPVFCQAMANEVNASIRHATAVGVAAIAFRGSSRQQLYTTSKSFVL